MQVFKGICNASAAEALDSDHFIVAEDEHDWLLVYRTDKNKAKPCQKFTFLQTALRKTDKETDIEASARKGKRIYWISSHGRDGEGTKQPNRHRFFATDIGGDDGRFEVDLVANRYFDRLVPDLLDAANWTPTSSKRQNKLRAKIIALISAASKLDIIDLPRLAPKKHGLNIEALAACKQGPGLLIGLRNPLYKQQAIVLHLLNPDELLEVPDAPARLGDVRLFDFGGLGLRSMAWSKKLKSYIMIAGSPGTSSRFKLYRWSGDEDVMPVFVKDLDEPNRSNPEGLVVYPRKKKVLVLNDQGKRRINGKQCHKKKEAKRYFIGRWHKLN